MLPLSPALRHKIFLLIVIVVSILLNSVIPWGSLSLRVVFKLLLLPVVVAVSYEIIKLCGKYDNPCAAPSARPACGCSASPRRSRMTA